MHVSRLIATLTTVAFLLTACGFVPPSPPAPDNSRRIAINRVDPRQMLQREAQDSAHTDAMPVRIALDTPSDTSPAPPSSAAPSASISSPPDAAASAPAQEAPSDSQATAGPHPEVAAPPLVVKEIWHLDPTDGTVRQALARWAAKANWTFGPDQWELNFDLPIQAPAQFEAETFQEATQALSEAIAMTESPVRPCFYANRVLRVIPFTRSCNRASTPTSPA